MVFNSLEQAIAESDPERNYHYVRLITGRWVRVEGEPVGLTVKRLDGNKWEQVGAPIIRKGKAA